MLPKPRPVDPEWKCKHSGDCCTIPKETVMTKEEAAVLVHHAPSTIHLNFRPIDEKFVALQQQPCPLFVFGGCLVYSVRPYNCRRFLCMRPDIKAEPFEASGANMTARTETNRAAWRMAKTNQRRARRWADKHGWNDAQR